MFKLRKGWSFESGVSKHEHTPRLKKMQMNQVQKSYVETVWCMAVQDIVVDDHRDHIEKHEGRSEHRDESSRRIKSCGKVITNSETGQNLEKWSGRSRLTNKTQAEDRVRDVKRIRAERVERSKIGTRNTQIIRDEFADASKLENGKLRELVMRARRLSKLEQETRKN